MPEVLRGLVPAARRRSGTAGAGSTELRRTLAALPEDEREQAVLDLVLAQVAVVLGFASGKDVDARRVFSELGFDSLTAVQFRNALNEATGLRLPATLVFDYPSPAVLARKVLDDLHGTQQDVRVRSVDAAWHEPIAIVGMACRYPGGVGSPEDLWGVVAEGRDVVSGFPGDRGWDLASLVDVTGERPDSSYVDQGGFLYGAGEFDCGF
ncbi:acyl carrier protein, partial [Streptomyces endocoffeicus]|uniref:acyl carrier protein n=1 Tax=Streptomyces endocoffeicus TaxID=2898945 RepID=UPI0027DBC732